MALREFGKGLVGGLQPIVQQGVQEKAQERIAEKESKRKLKHLQSIATFQAKLKREIEDAQFEDQLERLGTVGSLDPDTGRLLAAGSTPAQAGMVTPSQKYVNPMEMKLLGLRGETEKARRAYWEQPRPATAASMRPSPESERQFEVDRTEMKRFYKVIEDNMPVLEKSKYEGVPDEWSGNWERVKSALDNVNRIRERYGHPPLDITDPRPEPTQGLAKGQTPL